MAWTWTKGHLYLIHEATDLLTEDGRLMCQAAVHLLLYLVVVATVADQQLQR